MSVSINVEIDIEAHCSSCGNTLSIHKEEYRNETVRLSIDPCDTCLDKTGNEQYDIGYSNGNKDGYDEAAKECNNVRSITLE